MNFEKHMCELFGEEFTGKLIEEISHDPIGGFRINTLKVNDDRFLSSFDGIKPHPFVKNGYIYDKTTLPLGKSAYHNAGAYYIQEPSAMLVGELLAPNPNDKVIDLCAAPGGKTTHVASFLNEDGFLLSNDYNMKRAKILSENVERLGISNVMVTCEDIAHLASLFPGEFDKVLLDAPCSGEGMFRKNAEVYADWSLEKVESLAIKQKKLILKAYSLLKRNGIMIYSTCTFETKENEDVINYLLSNTHASLIELPEIDGTNRGINMPSAIRIFPQSFPGEGHFICLIRCNDDNTYIPHYSKKYEIGRTELKILNDFVTNNLNMTFQRERLEIRGGHIHYLPKNMLNSIELNILRNGLDLGEIISDRFVPSHSLAMASHKSDWKRTIDFMPNSIEVANYLHGESFPVKCDDGFALVLVNGISIGLAKISRGILKNYYPKSLRTK